MSEHRRRPARRPRTGFATSDRELAEQGLAAPAIAFGFSFSILFREGARGRAADRDPARLARGRRARANYRRPLALGRPRRRSPRTAVTCLLATFVIDIAPVNREVMEAVTALLAVGVLFAVSFWLVSRLEQRRWMEFMRARAASAIAAGSALAFAGLGFTAVYREGFETVLFYQALDLFAEGLSLWVALGAVAAAARARRRRLRDPRARQQLPLKPMLIGGASVLLLLSVAFAGNAVRSLQEVDVIDATPIDAAGRGCRSSSPS